MLIRDVFSFRVMLLPSIVQILFWLIMIVCIGIGITNIIQEHYRYAIEILIIGPLLTRLAAELLLIGFRIYATLIRIEEQLQKK